MNECAGASLPRRVVCSGWLVSGCVESVGLQMSNYRTETEKYHNKLAANAEQTCLLDGSLFFLTDIVTVCRKITTHRKLLQ